MIIYFSGTGNSKYIAKRIADELGEKTVLSLHHLIDHDRNDFILEDGENFGFICPIYWEGLPVIVEDFLRGASFSFRGTDHYSWLIGTYGNDCGNFFSVARNAFEQKGIRFDSCFDLLTAGNWGPYYELKNPEYVRGILVKEDEGIRRVINHIRNKDCALCPPDEMTPAQYRRMRTHYEKIRETKLFRLNEKACISCGLCEKQCPVHAIRLQEGKPGWVKEKCTLCLGCLSRCPVQAIDYKEGFLKFGRYTHPGVEPDYALSPVEGEQTI